MNTEPTSKRQDLIEGLRALADFYEAHPHCPLPRFPEFVHCARADNDTDGMAEVVAVAEDLGVPVKFNAGSADAEHRFAGLRFRAYYVSRDRSKAWSDDMRFLEERRAGR